MKISKKTAALILCVTAVAQTAVPFLFIREKKEITEKGETARFRVVYAEADSDTKLDVGYYFPIDEEGGSGWAILEKNDAGIYELTDYSTRRPDSGEYLKSASSGSFVCPLEKLRVPDAKRTQADVLIAISQGMEVYTEAKVSDGRAVPTAIVRSDGTDIFRY